MRKIIAILSIICIMSIIAGCGKPVTTDDTTAADKTPTTTTADTSEQTELSQETAEVDQLNEDLSDESTDELENIDDVLADW
ncbi:hypothetical protein ACFL0W_03670 [Nanoarchaeota archaeon]